MWKTHIFCFGQIVLKKKKKKFRFEKGTSCSHYRSLLENNTTFTHTCIQTLPVFPLALKLKDNFPFSLLLAVPQILKIQIHKRSSNNNFLFNNKTELQCSLSTTFLLRAKMR